MKEIIIKHPLDLHKIFIDYSNRKGMVYWFRGQASKNWCLLPKAAREPYFLDRDRDLGKFKAWVENSVSYTKELISVNLEGLAIAQHYGLATRLLDWSANPLIAAYFAVKELEEEDGAIYIFEPDSVDFLENDAYIDRLKNDRGVFGFIPRPIDNRLLNQSGRFTIHCSPKLNIEVNKSRNFQNKETLLRVLIPSDLKYFVQRNLEDYGICDKFLFPDLAGLSQSINMHTILSNKKIVW